jgi:hypothetical protein
VVEPQLQLLEVIQSRGLETGFHGRFAGVQAGNAEAAAGALVRGKDALYGSIKISPTEVTAVKVERRGAPEVAPSGREDLGAGAFFGGEQGDDVAKDGIGEGADMVYAFFIFPNSEEHQSLPLRTRNALLHFHLHGRGRAKKNNPGAQH